MSLTLAVDVAAPAGLVAPGGRVVMGQSADAATNGGAPVSVAYGTRLMLNNGGEEVSLCLGPCAEGVVLDRVTWGDLGAAYDGHALVLDRGAGTALRVGAAVRNRRRFRNARRARRQLRPT